MLQIASNDGSHPDVVRQTRHSGPQAADTPDDELNRHAALRYSIKRANHLRIDQRVHLHHNLARAASVGGTFLGDELEHSGTQPRWRHQQALILRWRAIPGEIVEQFGQVITQCRVAREDADVFVDTGRGGVVVTRGHMAVTPQSVCLAPHHQRDLGMGFESHHPVHHVYTGLFQFASPGNVGQLVEAGGDLDQYGHLFAARDGTNERIHDLSITRCAVKRQLDGEYQRIQRCFFDEAFHRRRKALVRMMDE